MGSVPTSRWAAPGGREALRRLRNVIGRMESAWSPASAEESFEIVRRRLFQPIAPEAHDDRATRPHERSATSTAPRRPSSRASAGSRRTSTGSSAPIPIHPELFARLYEDWSTLDRFQRTRGVLRLMAAVIHSLWAAGDQSPLILPAAVPLADPTVSAELTRNLEDAWRPILDADIDGTTSVAYGIDADFKNLGRFGAARACGPHGLPRLGATCEQPEPRRRRRAGAARLRAARRARRRLRRRAQAGSPTGRPTSTPRAAGPGSAPSRASPSSPATAPSGTASKHPTRCSPRSSAVFAQRATTTRRARRRPRRPVVIGRRRRHAGRSPRRPRTRGRPRRPDQTGRPRSMRRAPSSTQRGTTPRIYRNALVFLAADDKRREDLEHGVADFLAWESIDEEATELGLDLHQAGQAHTPREDTDRPSTSGLPTPTGGCSCRHSPTPPARSSSLSVRADGQGSLGERVGRKLVAEGSLYLTFPPVLLRRPARGPPSSAVGGRARERRRVLGDVRPLRLPATLHDESVLLGSGSATRRTSTTWSEGHVRHRRCVRRARRAVPRPDRAGSPNHVTPGTLVVRPDAAAPQLAREASERVEEPQPKPQERDEESNYSSCRQAKVRRNCAAGRRTPQPRLRPDRAGRSGPLDEPGGHRRRGDARSRGPTYRKGFPEDVIGIVRENARSLRFVEHDFE